MSALDAYMAAWRASWKSSATYEAERLDWHARAREPRPEPPTFRPVDVTGWTVEELDDLADADAWAEAAYADRLEEWEARHEATCPKREEAELR